MGAGVYEFLNISPEQPIRESAFLKTRRQIELYRAGPQQGPAVIPLSADDLEAAARAKLSAADFDWIFGGAGSGATMRANRSAFERWQLVPRMLCDVAERDHSVQLCGKSYPTPVLLAPIGVQCAAHPAGEIAAARAAAQLGIPFVLSTVASQTIEAVAQSCGDGPRWFQLYWSSEQELTRSLIRRAEQSGYEALVVTLDTQALGWRETNLTLAHLPFLQGIGLANYFSDPVFRAALANPPEEDLAAAVEHYLSIFSDLKHTWDDLVFITDHTRLPVLVKGIQHPQDVGRALDAGVQGIIVSNHGGRQVDGAVGSLEMLPEIVEQTAGRVPVLFDSGIRRGSDALKALALGAAAVLVGRPYLYALSLGGQAGVETWLENFLADLDLNMALCGRRSVTDLGIDDLRRTLG